MKRRKTSTDIRDILLRHRGHRTVLGVGIPVLAGHISALVKGCDFDGLTEAEIAKEFESLTGQFMKSEYHSTYLDRRLGRNGFLERMGDRFRIRSSLLGNISTHDLEKLCEELVASLRSAYEQRQSTMKRLEEVCQLPVESIEARRSLVDGYLRQLTGNQGEMFEVVSFAVLREYFRAFGFSLQRFSTTQANDGGMDFVASNAIYQVTTDESLQKVRRDLAKSPGTKRVLVRPTVTDEIVSLCESDVLEAIDLSDLLNHFVGWLLSRDTRSKRANHLQRVLLGALEEFRRENRADTA